MTDQLTSVRLSGSVLEALRLFADARGTSVAAEIRAALDRYVAAEKATPELESALREAARRQYDDQERLIDRVLSTGR